MYRFFCPILSDVQPGRPSPELIVHLDPDETHHARRVLRLELGQAVFLFDGLGRTAKGTLAAWNDGAGSSMVEAKRRGGQAIVRIEEITHAPQPQPSIDLAVAIPKGGHADDMIAGLSQVGVSQLFPLRAQRAVVEPRPGKIDRFNRAAIESAKQCGRPYLMTVSAPLSLPEVLVLDHDLRLIAAPPPPGAPSGTEGPASAAITGRLKSATRILILIGPEGGWSPDELRTAAAAHCIAWSLGPNIMRIETAATAAAAIAGYLVQMAG